MSVASIAFDIVARDNASAKFDHLGKQVDQTHGKFSKLSGGLKTAAKVGMLGIAGGAVIAGAALVKMAKAAAEDEQGQVRLATALKNNAGATKGQVAQTESWISKQGRLLGVTDDELRPALGKLVTATHDVGKAQKLASLAMDVSAGTGKSLETVSEALMKAQNGQVAGLSRLGVATKDASGKTLSMTELTKNLADTFGGQASAKANTFQGKMDRLKLMFDETKETIGAKLLPMLTTLGTWFLNKGVPAISAVWSWLSQKLGPVFKEVGGFISDTLVPAIKNLVDKFKDGGSGAGKLKQAFSDMQPAIHLVVGVLKGVWNVLSEFVIPVVMKIVGTTFPLMAKAIGVVGQAGIWLWNNALAPAFRFIVSGVGHMMEVWGKMLGVLGNVPGFEWAKRAGDKMTAAGQDAVGFANKIKAIPESHNTRATFDYANASDGAYRLRSIYAGIPDRIVTQAITQHIDKFERVGRNAAGTSNFGGGWTTVGEQGAELVRLPAGSQVVNHDRASQMMAGGGGGGGDQSLTVNLNLDGKTVQQVLLKVKRENGGLALGIA